MHHNQVENPKNLFHKKPSHTSIIPMTQPVDSIITKERIYLLPHASLRGVISHYTLFRAHTPKQAAPVAEELCIVPDASGCVVCDVHAHHVHIHFWGPSSQVAVVNNGLDVVPLMFFVEFLPGGFHAILHCTMDFLRDERGTLDALDPALHRSLYAAFSKFNILTHTSALPELRKELDHIFLMRLKQNAETHFAAHLLARIHAAKGILAVQDLAHEVRCSPRHLNRVISGVTGLSPKLFSRIVRINAVCQTLGMPGQADNLTSLAQDFHYHDQAHFIHDFKAVCGISPSVYAVNLSDFYNEELKFGAIPSR